MDKIEFENGSIIESIDNIGQTIRGKIRGTYIDTEEHKSFFEGYRPNYYFKTEPKDLTESILVGKDKYASCNSISNPITLDDLEKWAEKLNQLPPSPTGIEIGSKIALDILLKHIPITKKTKGISLINGISVSIVEGTDLKFNQMKLKYSDGSNKVMDVFSCNDKMTYKNIFDKEDK